MRPDLTPSDILDPDFLQSVVRQATYQCRADGSGFYLCIPEWGHTKLLATHNLPKTPWDDDLPARVIHSRQAVIETTPEKSIVLAAPLIWQDAVRGILIVFNDSPDRTFRDRDIKLLQSLADMTASVAQQNERLALMTTQFRALHAIDVALTSSLELDRILNLILENGAELVGAEHGSLRQLEPESGKLVLRAHYGSGWTPQKLAYTPRVGEGIVRWVAENRRPYLCPDVREDSLYVVLFENMRSSVAVPLQYRREGPSKPDSFLGVLLLESSRLAAFDEQDVELLEALAQAAVIAIQNATQHRKLVDEQEKRLAAEKWAMMGQAATALAHRINNLMGIVPVSAGEIHRALADLVLPGSEKKWIEANLGRIERNAKFILKLSDSLFRPFKESGPTARLDINQLMKEALDLADLPADIELLCEFDPSLPPVKCSLLLLDVYLELITNACKAMENRAVRQLSIGTLTEKDEAGVWAVVQVKDTGRGIASDQMPYLWEMFQKSENGLGFGLWWLRTFIARQGGTIDCFSNPDDGTTFIVRLPALSDTVPSVA